jgi:hypothetical protein
VPVSSLRLRSFGRFALGLVALDCGFGGRFSAVLAFRGVCCWRVEDRAEFVVRLHWQEAYRL